MFTLKIKSGDVEMWFPGVTLISKLHQGALRDVRDGCWRSYEPRDYCAATDASSDLIVTLLMVEFSGNGPDSAFYCYAPQAWLLGPTGATVERLAP